MDNPEKRSNQECLDRLIARLMKTGQRLEVRDAGHALLEPPIACYERLQHVRNQRRRVNSLALCLCVQCGIAVKVGLKASRV